MFLSNIRLKNYKCFENELIELNVPDGVTPGSGLTLLVGENNSGKTTLFSALTKLKSQASLYSIERRNGADVTITLTDSNGETKIIKNKPGSAHIEVTGESNLSMKNFDIIKDNKFWTGTAGDNRVTYDWYKNQQNFNRGATDGNLAMALISLVDDDKLKLRFDTLIKEIFPDFREWTNDADDPSTGMYIKYKVSDNQYVKIDHSVGSGILSVFRIVYSIVADGAEKIIMIDEPEVYLHPQAQQNLLKVLERESAFHQIIFTTHSPFMFRGITKSARFVSLMHDKSTGSSVSELITGFILPNGPTYGEVTFFVYNIPTVEFHTELYGHLSYLYDVSGLTGGKDNFIQSNILIEQPTKRKRWMDDRKGCSPESVTLQTYIRHSIHHPENTCSNVAYTPAQLQQSIEEMIVVVRNLQANTK